MGRKKKIDPDKVLEDLEALQEQIEDEKEPAKFSALEAEQDREELDVHRFLSQFGNPDYGVRITRVRPGQSDAYCGTIPLSALSEQGLQERFGDGKYHCMLVDPKGGYIRKRVVEIVDSPQKESPGQVSSSAEGESSTAFERFVSLQLQMQNSLIQSLLARDNDSDRSSFKEIAEAMGALKDVVRPPEGKSTTESLKELIDVFNKGMELGMQSTGKGPTGWLGVARDALDVLPGALKALKLGAASQAGQAAPDNAPSQLQGISPQVVQTLKAGIEYLKSRVRIGQGYQLWTDFIVANLDNPQWASMAHLLDRPIEDLAAIDPEIVNPLYKPWFEGLLGDLRNAIRNQAGATGQGSDAGGVAGDEEADPGSSAK